MALFRKRNKHHAVPRRELYIPRRTRWAIALSALGVVAVCLLIAAFVNGWITLPEWPVDDPDQTTPPVVQEDTVIHIVAGGDVNVTDKVVGSGGSGYDYSDVFLDILPVLSGADLTIANFEGNACGAPYGSKLSSAPEQLLSALRSAGVDVLQTANSRSVQNGLIGLAATNNAIRAAGMQPLGAYADAEEYEKYGGYLIYEIDGIRIALVAFTKGFVNASILPEGGRVNLLYTDYISTYKSIDREGITAVLQAAAAEEPDVIIAMLHWGGENNDLLSSSQKSICQLMAQQGVDAIIGTHSHHVQQMGFDENSGMFVAYCLGDLLGDADTANTNYSVLLDLEITKNGTTGEVSITGYDYTPIYLNYGDDGSLRLLRIREAISAYENNYIGAVSAETYSALKTALARAESRANG